MFKRILLVIVGIVATTNVALATIAEDTILIEGLQATLSAVCSDENSVACTEARSQIATAEGRIVVAEEISDKLFFDQVNGMTRLERLKPSFTIQSNQQNKNAILSDSAFIFRMFNDATDERLQLTPSLARKALFNNGRDRALKITKRAIAPSGLFRLCKDKLLSVCKQNSGSLNTNQNGQILMNPQLFAKLQQVNKQVNKDIQPENEKAGSKDNWQVNLAKGDCEDFALTKKAKLISQGWPSSALLITIVDTEWGERHAVLSVSTNQGDYLLDNLMNKVINVELSKYKFISRQGKKEGYSWTVLA